jgi:thymidylate synthase ThyX
MNTHFTASKNGIFVVVLNTESIVTAEDAAMLMALHSRSPAGIMSHLEKLAKSGSGNMMSSFYVGYGHKSIGDCGNTYIFIENISMLAAKAVQDSQLYSGQECSTRYIDFSKQPFADPIGSNASVSLLKTLREFYVESFPILVTHLKNENKIEEDEDQKVYDKAINARAFDILRGFLPAGATTNVAWNTNLRQAADRLLYLRNHPLKEVRDVADVVEEALQKAHPNSFDHKKYEASENYIKDWMGGDYYLRSNNSASSSVELMFDGVDRTALRDFQKYLSQRPAKTEIPKQIGICGNVRLAFHLDFGSYRDIQRHRAVNMRMPLVSIKPGFENWYMDQLPEDLKGGAKQILSSVESFTQRLPEKSFVDQYYIPMGYKVPIDFSGDLSAVTYLAELRATRFVHPTLQVRAVQIADILEKEFGEFGLKVHIDRNDVGRFDIKRGTQDITEK